MKNYSAETDVLVVGGGPAGMMAAWQASRNKKVILLERGGELGKKLLLTGGGRCNISNASTLEEYLAKIPRGGPFLRSAFSVFFHEELTELLGGELPLVAEGMRLYPRSQSAADVRDFFLSKLSRADIRTHARVHALEPDGEHWIVSGSAGTFRAGRVVIACGGASFPKTGSDGSFFQVLEQAGVRVSPLSASLVPMLTEPAPKELAGITCPDVLLGTKEAQLRGSLLFTHKGISGPAVLDLSALAAPRFPLVVTVDFAPDASEREIAGILFSGRKSLSAQARHFLPERLARFLFPQREDKHQLKKADIAERVRRIKAREICVTGFAGTESAIVTRGGVRLDDIRPKTLEHKTLRGLYFAGECLDADALSGGFNLQIAWSTGYVCGRQT